MTDCEIRAGMSHWILRTGVISHFAKDKSAKRMCCGAYHSAEQIDFRSRGIFFWTSHAMRLFMCTCCGLFAITQFHFECSCVLDDSW